MKSEKEPRNIAFSRVSGGPKAVLQQPAASLPPEANAVVISVNPIAGARSAWPRVERLVGLLSDQGFRVEIRTDLSEVADLANRWHGEGRLRALVGVGGDGTAAELVNRTEAGVPLTMLPSGNENLLARHLGLGASPESICRTITDGKLIRLDVGKANDRIFLLMISCGFDADVVRRVHGRRKGHIRTRDYFRPILESIRHYEYPELRLHWEQLARGSQPPADGLPSITPDGECSPPVIVRWLFAFNLPCYAGGLRLAPRADGADALLDICAFRRGSLRSGLRYAAAVVFRQHHRLADCTMKRVRRLQVTSDAEVPYQLDGDPGGLLPVDVEAAPDRLTMIVPKERAKDEK